MSCFCMGAPYPDGTCPSINGGLAAGGIVLGKDQPQSLQPVVCANNGGGTGYSFTRCVSKPDNILRPFNFFGSNTYISAKPISRQSCIPHDAPTAEVGSQITPTCSSLKADIGGWEVFWNGSAFQQGPRLVVGVNIYATGQLCDDDTYALDWPAKIVGGPFSGVTGFWRLRGHLSTCVDTICEDNNPCTNDSCNTTTGDICSGGVCQPSPARPRTAATTPVI